MKNKPTKKKVKSKKPETYMSFELDGKVYITERKNNGTIVSQEELDGELVLKCLISLLERGIKEDDQKNY